MIRRSSVFTARLLAAVLTPVVLVVLVGFALLAQGPISLGPLAEHLETVLSELDPRLRVKVEDAIITWDGEANRLEVRVVGARLSDPDGDPIATFGEMTVQLRARDLIFGRIVPLGIDVIRPKLEVLREADGRFFLRTGASDTLWPLEDVLGGFADSALTEEDDPGQFLRVSARHADLSFEDRASGIRVVAPDADLTAAQGQEMMTLSFAAIVQVQDQAVSVGIGLVRRAGAPRTDATVRFRGLQVAELPVMLDRDELAPLTGVTVTLDGIVDASIEDTGEVNYVDFDASLSPGDITLPERLSRALRVASGSVRGRLVDGFRRLVLKAVELRFDDGPRLYFAGEVSGFGGDLAVQGDGGFEGLRTDDLDVYWPLVLAPRARKWVTTNVADGIIPEGTLHLDIQPDDLTSGAPRDEMVRLDFRFEGVSSSYFRDLPRLHQGRGTGRVTGRTFSLDVPSARVLDLDVTKGRLFVADLLAEPPVLEAEFTASGAVAAALQLIDHEPLGFARDMGIDPAASEGQASTHTKLVIPLKKGLKLADVGVGATSTMRGYGSRTGFGDLPISDGDLTLEVDKAGLAAQGALKLNGVPATLQWQRSFKSDAAGDRLQLATTLDDAGRAALGLALDDRIAGPAATRADLVLGRDGKMAGGIAMDLGTAALSIPEIHWAKPAGTPAQLTLELDRQPGQGTALRNIALTSDDFRFDGDIGLDASNTLSSLNARSLRFGRTSMTAALARRDDGTLDLQVSGDSVDLQPHFADDDDAADADTALDLSARFGTVWLTDDVRMTDVRAVGSLRQGAWQVMQGQGAVNGGPAAWLAIEPQADGRMLELVSGDAGAIVRALDIADGIHGGRMRLTATLPPAGVEAPARGLLRADDFRVTNAPILAQVLTVGSLTGILDLLQGEGIAFARLDMPFTLAGDQLEIKDARAVGPALGLTANIQHDRRTGAIVANGTIVPAYTLNSALGRIPFIGEFFVGRKGEGIFAMTYGVKGTIEKPEVSVNPLTALAPGFLRNIITGLDKPAVSPTEIPLLKRLEQQRDVK